MTTTSGLSWGGPETNGMGVLSLVLGRAGGSFGPTNLQGREPARYNGGSGKRASRFRFSFISFHTPPRLTQGACSPCAPARGKIQQTRKSEPGAVLVLVGPAGL